MISDPSLENDLTRCNHLKRTSKKGKAYQNRAPNLLESRFFLGVLTLRASIRGPIIPLEPLEASYPLLVPLPSCLREQQV